MQSPEETFFVQEPHVLLRRGRWMLLEGRARGLAHQPRALRSAQRGEGRHAGRRMSVLHDADEGRDEGALDGKKMRVRDISELIADSTGAAKSK
jgi:hypothetical protein